MHPKLKIKIGKLWLKNPVMAASGTFGYAEEFRDFADLRKLGAIVTKTITLNPRRGNPPPRTCETPAGMLNSIGLENPGLECFIKEKLSFLKKLGVPIIVSIASEGDSQEFVSLAKRLDRIKEVSAIELNISCPNIKRNQKPARPGKAKRARETSNQSYKLISQDPRATYALVQNVRRVTRKALITKLSPNVTDIAEIAQAAESAGCDAVSLINTLSGMSIDIDSRKPRLGNLTGGLSGPAIRPVAVRMVWEVYQKVKIPVIGMGGISDTLSALEFFLAGASAIAVGTANFINPGVTIEIIDGIKKYLSKNKIKDIKTLIGSLKL
ncbi:MAG: dihydroorotate dehydrogenase [Omnitrophica WOR_2 bacterium RIFCSPLOWO2_02_FULL_45_28]|nr:MAG: dihydroorotate dehydrogenase [Omnitrophica WOR_2 bacterium RIFCSPLOWO2_02_FULL_45_28]